jgi:hypothetical protein
VVTYIEGATEYKEIALGAFLDIERASDRSSFDVITHAAERYDTEPTVCRWICSMLESKNTRAIHKVTFVYFRQIM